MGARHFVTALYIPTTEEETTTLSRNVEHPSPSDSATYPRRMKISNPPLPKPKILQTSTYPKLPRTDVRAGEKNMK